MKGIMIQGTASDVGKSLIATALCRLFYQDGYKVVPFKSQNMSNNSYVTADGKEIGRAQGLQAEAANVEADVLMNPILLKPTGNGRSEIVLFGERVESLSGMDYRKEFYEKGLKAIQGALLKLENVYDCVVIEGAGSSAEINLKDRELVNMKVAELADVPVILVADIDRGGVFASIVGTLQLFTESERNRVKGLIINKFRGDAALFEDGKKWLEDYTGIPVLGVLPYLPNHMVEGEDSLSLTERFKKGEKNDVEIAVMKLPYISNFSDLEAFLYEEDVSVYWVSDVSEFGQPDAVIIPGTKSTFHDLSFLKETGLAEKIIDFSKRGGSVVGICGGFQMLGDRLIDEDGSDTGLVGNEMEGLRLIPATTFFHNEKRTVRVKAKIHPNFVKDIIPMEGYEIHLGKTETSGPYFLQLEDGTTDGYAKENIIGTYMHHLFHNDEWRNLWLNQLRKHRKDIVHVSNVKDEKYDELALHMKKHLDWEKTKNIMEEWTGINESLY
ncbi:adenosylcobyric acid synthase [Oikeobacillus pervagus]|uniref:Cobyric acid synthase n=1 Tax=Oikeobacillus pervagus TaxID=1325931 RepID=A0AAJ1T395_9BACI|nr:cobyric acid synthase [Oikeobacillus pervagus]MDQ0216417.1 adenosylcobyric acid synthase [Oikeobacillus pervagus]